MHDPSECAVHALTQGPLHPTRPVRSGETRPLKRTLRECMHGHTHSDRALKPPPNHQSHVRRPLRALEGLEVTHVEAM